MTKELLFKRFNIALFFILYGALFSKAQYCLPPADIGTSLGSFINAVNLPGLSNPTGPSASPFFTYYSDLNPVQLQAGGDYILSLTSGSMANDYYAVWVDWNNDLDFFDAGELLGEQTNSTFSETLIYPFNVPINTSTSFKRMRIRCGPNINLEPCLNYSYGETEDYTLLVQPAPSNYCIPSSFAGSESGNFIQTIRLNDFVNSTGISSSPHYFFADSLLKPIVTKGSTQILKVMGGTSTINRYAAWIDWNNDGDYNDAGENIGDEPNTQAYQQHSFYFQVPDEAEIGLLRMRVRCAESFSGNLNPCANYSNGETEDYLIEAIDSISGYCTPQFSEGTSNNTFINRITLDNLFYDLYASGAPEYYLNYSNSFNSAPLKNTQNYLLYLGVQGDAFATTRYAAWIDYNRDGDFLDSDEYLGETSMNSAYASSTISFVTPAVYAPGRTRLRVIAAPIGITQLQSCGTYTFGECKDFAVELNQFSGGLCMPGGNTNQGDFINRFEIGNVIQNEGAQGGAPYHYYENSVYQTFPGANIQLNMQGGSSASFPVYYGAWIDWNNNLDFESNECVGLDTISEDGNLNLLFNTMVPANQARGFIHMRIRCVRNAVNDSILFTACSEHTYGETEDYRIYIDTVGNEICTELHSNTEFNGASIDAVRLINSDLLKNFSGVESLSGNAYSSWPIDNQMSTTLVQPQTYYLRVNASGNNPRIGAWFDLNQNHSFETTEFYPIYTAPSSNQFFFLLSIPPNTPTGYIRLRIRVRSGGVDMGANEACNLFDNGETEDFQIYVSSSRGLPPNADFELELNGGEATYTSLSANFPDYWVWFFEGGNPPTTLGDNATVYYYNNLPGCLSTSITISNFYGTDTYVNPCAIYIPESQSCSSLMFSEYICNAENNKALELVNASNLPIDLSEWEIAQYSNGSLNPSLTIQLSGSLEPYQTLVIAHPTADSTLMVRAAFSSGICNFDGNDVLALLKNNVIVDVIGNLSENPPNGWPVGAFTTKNVSMRRASLAGFPSGNWLASLANWMAFAPDAIDNLGSHSFVCGTYVEPGGLDANFSISQSTICSGDFITLLDQSNGTPVSWVWSLPGATNESLNGANPGAVYYPNPGIYSISLSVGSANGLSDTETIEQALTVLPYPAPVIGLQDGWLVCNGCADNTIWYVNGSELIGENGTSIQPLLPGIYNLSTENAAGCEAFSSDFIVYPLFVNGIQPAEISIYPNPTHSDFLSIKNIDCTDNSYSFEIIDLTGRTIVGGTVDKIISLAGLPSGNYFIRILLANKLVGIQRLIKY